MCLAHIADHHICEQIRETAANAGVVLAGENALPVFNPGGIDAVALERIVYNTRVGPKSLELRAQALPLQ